MAATRPHPTENEEATKIFRFFCFFFSTKIPKRSKKVDSNKKNAENRRVLERLRWINVKCAIFLFCLARAKCYPVISYRISKIGHCPRCSITLRCNSTGFYRVFFRLCHPPSKTSSHVHCNLSCFLINLKYFTFFAFR